MFDEEDEIVEEIPIYLNNELEESISILQFPTKNLRNPLQECLIKNCRMKPNSGEMKIDLAIDVDSDYFDHKKATSLAEQVDGKLSTTHNSRKTYANGVMDVQTFASINSLGDASNFVLATFVENEMHLTPIKCILQMRPTFSYLNKADKLNKANKKAAEQSESGQDDVATPVLVKFARPVQAGKKAKVKGSLLKNMKNSNDEPWCDMLWRTSDSAAADIVKQQFCNGTREPVGIFSQDCNKYKLKLLPALEIQQEDDADDLLPTMPVAKRRLRLFPFKKQLHHFLKNGKVFSFNTILNYFQENVNAQITADKILRILPQVGVLVNGNWVAQSELKYPEDKISAANGICAKIMACARDYVLYKLTRDGFVYRRQILHHVKLPFQEVMEVLQSVAHITSQNKWTLLLPPDLKFEQQHPELVQRQDLVWRSMESTFIEMDRDVAVKHQRKRSERERKISQASTN